MGPSYSDRFPDDLTEVERIEFELATADREQELRSLADEIEVLLADIELSREPRRTLSSKYAQVLMRLGRTEKSIRVLTTLLERVEPSVREEICESFFVVLEAIDSDAAADVAIELLDYSDSEWTRAGLLFEAVSATEPSDVSEASSDWREISGALSDELGVCPLDEGLSGFRALYQLYKADRATIDRAWQNGEEPEFTNLDLSYWRSRLEDLDPPPNAAS